MSDEAVVRIVLDSSKSGGGGAKPPSSTSTQSAPVAPQPSSQQPPQQQTTTAPQRDWVKDLIEGIAGANRHVLIEGQSGSGKSLLTRHIAFERMQRGEEVNVVDVHTPEAWKGAKQVFQGAAAGDEAAAFLKEALDARKQEAQEAKLRGEQPQFKDMTIVLSDFARLMKDSPQLRDEFKTLMTEARKFRISIVADTTALTGAATGIKGIQDVINNFSQKVKLAAPTAETPHRTAETGGKVFQTPILPEYKERIDYGLVKPYRPPPPPPPAPFDPVALARARLEREKQLAAVEEEYRKLKPPEPPTLELAFDPVEVARKRIEREKQLEAADAEYKKLKPPELPEVKSTLDKTTEALGKMRGMLGGLGGTLLGSALDIMAAVKEGKKGLDVVPGSETVGGGLGGLGKAPTRTFGKPSPAGIGKGKTADSNIPSTLAARLSGSEWEVGTGAGMMSTLMEVAGPVAAGVAAARAIQGAIDNTIKSGIKSAVGAASGVAMFAADPNADPSVPIQKFGESLSEAGEKTSGAFSYLATIAGESAKALGSLMQAVDQTAQRYGEYSPQIAQAQAVAEIRHTMGDLRRSSEISASMAKYIAANSDLQQKFENIKIQLLSKILPMATRVLEIIEGIMPNEIGGVAEAIMALAGPLGTISKAVTQMLHLEEDKKVRFEDPTSQLFDDAFMRTPGQVPGQPGWVPNR